MKYQCSPCYNFKSENNTWLGFIPRYLIKTVLNFYLNHVFPNPEKAKLYIVLVVV